MRRGQRCEARMPKASGMPGKSRQAVGTGVKADGVEVEVEKRTEDRRWGRRRSPRRRWMRKDASTSGSQLLMCPLALDSFGRQGVITPNLLPT
jgi:hypothetical protein